MNTAVLLLATMLPSQPPLPMMSSDDDATGAGMLRIGDEIGSRRLLIGRKIKISVKDSPNAVIYISPRVYDNSTAIKWKRADRMPLFWRFRNRGMR